MNVVCTIWWYHFPSGISFLPYQPKIYYVYTIFDKHTYMVLNPACTEDHATFLNINKKQNKGKQKRFVISNITNASVLLLSDCVHLRNMAESRSLSS